MQPWIQTAMNWAVRVYYRIDLTGEMVPPAGPVLLVANHPNSLLDAAMVALAARRAVRFLAKSTLFDDPTVAAPVRWLVRASGAIPVYRRIDGVAPAGANDEAFRAVRTALADGSAVALFPEGISHARSSLAPLKTGAARLALGTAQTLGHPIPIVPIGILLTDRAIFRSSARLIVGQPIGWDDLAGRPESDAAAVRELTNRIQAGLRGVTLNYASWEEADLVNFANAVRSDGGPPFSPSDRLADDPTWQALAHDLKAHARLLRTLRLTPEDLYVRTDLATAFKWTLRRIPLLALAGITTVGTALAWPAYRIVGPLAAKAPHARDVDVHATAKLLIGAAVFLLWTALLAVVAGIVGGMWAGLATLIVAPALALTALLTTEGWQTAWRDARRFLTLRHRHARVADLRRRQLHLAKRIEAIVSSDGPRPTDTQPAAHSG